MTPSERTMLRTLIDRARRAQIDAVGGYHRIEMQAGQFNAMLDRCHTRPGNTIPTPRPKRARRSPTGQTKRRIDHDHARRLRAQGLSYPQIAAELGCDHSTVMYACRPELRARKTAQMAEYRRRNRERKHLEQARR